MVDERVVLFRVEHFQQRRARVAAEVLPHLAHFVQKEQRVAHAHLGHVLHDLAGHRADVRAAMAANLRLVAHTTQRHPDELAPGGARHRLAERGLAHAGRSDQAQDRRLQAVDALLHREILDDALLHLLEPVMVGVEDFHRVRQIFADLAPLAPGQRQQRVDVVAHDRGFGRHGRHHLELLQLAQDLAFGLLRHLGGLDLLFHLLEIGVLVALAQFLLDGLDLLVQVVLALALLHLALDAAADALFNLQDVDLAFEHAQQMLEPLADFAHFEDVLLLLELER